MQLSSLETMFAAFITEAHRLKTKYADRIHILVGLETEYITPIDLDRLKILLDQHGSRIQYLVGSVHHVNQIPIDLDEETYSKALGSFSTGPLSNTTPMLEPGQQQMESYLCSYFDAQYELFRQFTPEIIGHMDLCRLYNPTLRLADYPHAFEKLQRNVAFATQYGALFEFNAAALRKGWVDAYPGEEVVKVRSIHTQISENLISHYIQGYPKVQRKIHALGRQPWSPCRGAELRFDG